MFDIATSLQDCVGWPSARVGLGLHQVRYVLAAAEHGGFRPAARRLGVQQSAVSRRIQDLEDRLGVRLFDRSPNGVRLTSAGRSFVSGAHEALIDLDRTVGSAVDLGRDAQRQLRIGVLAGFGGGLEAGLRAFLDGEPDLRLELQEGCGRQLADALARRRIDVAFGLSMPRSAVAQHAWRERVVAALRLEDSLAKREAVSWRDLAGRRVLVPSEIAADLGAMARRRGGGEVCAQAAGAQALARLVAWGQGVALLPEGAALRVNGVVYRPLVRTFLTIRAAVMPGPRKDVLARLLERLAASRP